MAIFSRKPAGERPARPVRVRVRLTREESQLVNRLKPTERKLGYGLAAAGAVLGVVQAVLNDELKDNQRIMMAALAVLLGVAMAVCARYTNRLALQMASIGWVFVLGIVGVAYLGFFMYLTFKSSNDRRKMIEEKARTGRVEGVAARELPRSAKSSVGSGDSATDDRGYPLPSRRYTPPKHKPKASTKR